MATLRDPNGPDGCSQTPPWLERRGVREMAIGELSAEERAALGNCTKRCDINALHALLREPAMLGAESLTIEIRADGRVEVRTERAGYLLGLVRADAHVEALTPIDWYELLVETRAALDRAALSAREGR